MPKVRTLDQITISVDAELRDEILKARDRDAIGTVKPSIASVARKFLWAGIQADRRRRGGRRRAA